MVSFHKAKNNTIMAQSCSTFTSQIISDIKYRRCPSISRGYNPTKMLKYRIIARPLCGNVLRFRSSEGPEEARGLMIRAWLRRRN